MNAPCPAPPTTVRSSGRQSAHFFKPEHQHRFRRAPAPRGQNQRAVGRPLLILVAAILWLAAPARAQGIAAGGSPLYLLAVRESVQGLKSRGAPAKPAAQAQAQAPAHNHNHAPAGARRAGATNRVALTPDFLSRYYFCTNCQAWHLRNTPLTSILQQNAAKGLVPALTNLTLRRTNLVRPGAPPK